MFIRELGASLKERRKLLGITQKHLAELAGVNANTVIRIENAKINPTVEIVNSIAEVLGMELILRVKKPGE
jgi:transcriptional regulator with XRE-family HTH domain